ncbi:MAG: RNA polymerase sigma factor, partial [Thermocrispum sp.]
MKADLEGQFQDFAERQVLTLRRFAYLLCADWHLAEDLVQTALLKMYRAWPKLRDRDTVTRYARRAVLNCWLDEKRRPWRRSESRDGDVPDVPDPAADLDLHGQRAVDRERVLRAMTELAPRQRAVLVLRFWEDLSVAETAATMRCSDGNVKSQRSNLRRQVRRAARRGSAVQGDLPVRRAAGGARRGPQVRFRP